MPQSEVNHRLFASDDSLDISLVPVDYQNCQNTSDEWENQVSLTKGNDENWGDSDDAGSTRHRRQEKGADKNQAGNAKQRRVICQQDPCTGRHRLTTMKMVENGNSMAEWSEESKQQRVDTVANPQQVGLTGG